jgi:hypothetical protein
MAAVRIFDIGAANLSESSINRICIATRPLHIVNVLMKAICQNWWHSECEGAMDASGRRVYPVRIASFNLETNIFYTSDIRRCYWNVSMQQV